MDAYDTRTNEQLDAAMDAAHTTMTGAHSQLLADIAEHDRREAWRDWGARDEAGYLMHRFDLLAATARRWVTAAHTLSRNPTVAATYAEGLVSTDAMFSMVDMLNLQTPGASEPLGPFDDPTNPPPPDPPDPNGPIPDGPTPDGPTPDGPIPDGATPDGATPDGPTPDGPTPDGPADPSPDPSPDPLSPQLTAAQRRALVNALRRRKLDEANAAHRRRRLRTWDCDNGTGLAFDGAVYDDNAAIIRAALDEYTRTQTPDPTTGRYPTLEQTFADALIEFAAAYLGGRERRTSRPAIFFHAQDITPTQDGWAQTTNGAPLAAQTLRRLRCHCHTINDLADTDSNQLYLGRAERFPTWALAETIHRRDQGCRFPGCRRTRFTQCHHIREWDADHGPTNHDNLCDLCRYHHRLVHEGGWTITGNPTTTLTFTSPTGKTVTSNPGNATQPPNPPPDPPPNAAPPNPARATASPNPPPPRRPSRDAPPSPSQQPTLLATRSRR